MPALDLTGQRLKDTYPRVVQVYQGSFYDGLGNPITIPDNDSSSGYSFPTKEKFTLDGNTNYITLSHHFSEGMEEVYINGIFQSISDDYTVTSPNIVQFLFTPLATDKITVLYFITATNLIKQKLTTNGVTTLYTLNSMPILNTEQIYCSGILLFSGDDYTISGADIQFLFTPQTTDKIIVSYFN